MRSEDYRSHWVSFERQNWKSNQNFYQWFAIMQNITFIEHQIVTHALIPADKWYRMKKMIKWLNDSLKSQTDCITQRAWSQFFSSHLSRKKYSDSGWSLTPSYFRLKMWSHISESIYFVVVVVHNSHSVLCVSQNQ